MENIQKERKSLRRWQLVKPLLLGLAAIAIVYVALWFGIVQTKNKNPETLKGWQKTGTHYTLKTKTTMFNAHKISFPYFLDGAVYG